MKRYVDFPLEGGEKFRVEVSGDEERVTRGDPKDVIEPASVAFDAALAKLQPICSAIVRQARGLVDQPEEFSVEFGVKLSAEAGVVIASTAAEANLKVRVEWKRKEQKIETG
jgi:Trypsin-co-occurring domain 1